MTRRLPPLGLLLVLVPITMATSDVAAQVQGLVAPLPQACEENTHRILDVCTGAEQEVWSSTFDLGSFACQIVSADGAPSGQVCPGLDLSSVETVAPPCPIEVGRLEFMVQGTATTVLTWPPLPCATSYQVIRGLVGIPVLNPCDAQHPCPEGSFCSRPRGDCDAVGTCRTKPPGCTTLYDPVCGCDGVTYGNGCVANGYDAAIRCAGACPCPPACPYAQGCIEGGPVACRAIVQATIQQVQETENPVPGQAFFYLVRARGSGAVGTTTYGFTSDGRERLFEGVDCP